MQRASDQLLPANNTSNTTAQTLYNIAASSTPYITSAASTAAQAATSAATTATCYLSSLADTSPQLQNTDNTVAVQAPKKGRKAKDYDANITAALALPEIPPKPVSSALSWINSIAAATYHFLTPASPSASTPVAKNTSQSTICNQIKNLHTECTSLVHDDMTTSERSELDRLCLEKMNLIPDLIQEHAARRVDLFFYLCVAIYKTNADVSDGQTIKQHGIGSKEHGTHGCHSTLFSNPQLNNPRPVKSWIWSSLPTLMTLEGTHFLESLNMTVELPAEVNKFDKHLEGLYQRSSYVRNMEAILNKVSKGEIDPQQAMTDFLKEIDYFFIHFKNNYLSPNLKHGSGKPSKEAEEILLLPKTYEQIWTLQREGTFKAAKQGAAIKEIDPNYIYCMLKIYPLKKRPIFSSLDTYYLAMQKEIAESLTSNYQLPDPGEVLKQRRV